MKPVDLTDMKNRWVIGTSPAVTDPQLQSQVIQLKYNHHPDRHQLKNRETYHAHTHPIEEIYLVTEGWIKLRAGDEDIHLTKNQLLRVPPDVCHMIIDCSTDAVYFTIRAPKSDSNTKVPCM